MFKRKQFLWFVALVSLTACTARTPEQGEAEASDTPFFYASIESMATPGTRVYADSQLRVLWDADDRITIFDHHSLNREYKFMGETGDNSGLFEIVPLSGIGTGNDIDHLYAIHPFQSLTRIDYDGNIRFDVTSTQTYRRDTFGPGSNIMVAVSDDNDLIFKNVCGYLLFRFFGLDTQVQAISFKGNNNELLAGRALITASLDEMPVLSFEESRATKEITLECDPPVTLGSSLEDATSFWLVVPPTLFEQGITLTVTTPRGTFQKITTMPLEIKRNHRTPVSALRVDVATSSLQVYEVLDDGWNW